jgi:hypothetical protein
MLLYNHETIRQMFWKLRIYFLKAPILNVTDLHVITVRGYNCILSYSRELGDPQFAIA